VGADTQGLGRSIGDLGNQIHALVDVLELPVRFGARAWPPRCVREQQHRLL